MHDWRTLAFILDQLSFSQCTNSHRTIYDREARVMVNDPRQVGDVPRRDFPR
ncbi:hypothetical protein MnTg02_01125 [bacterium MnTg02]|nr:hypothetical protein MnTg02_01125 [bacterium MnTg02]